MAIQPGEEVENPFEDQSATTIDFDNLEGGPFAGFVLGDHLSGGDSRRSGEFGVTLNVQDVPVMPGFNVTPDFDPTNLIFTPPQQHHAQPATPGRISLVDAASQYWRLGEGAQVGAMHQILWMAGIDGAPNIKDPSDFDWGSHSNAWSKAYANAALQASRRGMTMAAYLRSRVNRRREEGLLPSTSGSGSGRGSGARGPVFVGQEPNPEVMKEVADQVAMKVYGRGATEEEAQIFMDGYRTLTLAEQRRAFDAQVSGGTAPELTPPDIAAQKNFREADPVEAKGFATLQAFNDVLTQINVGSGAG